MVEKPRIIGSMFCEGNYIDIRKKQSFAMITGADAIEIRCDTKRPNAVYYQTSLEVISTCMTKDEGGFFEGTLDEWADLLKNAVDYGTKYISIGLKQAKTRQGKELIKYAEQDKVKIIIGEHGQSMPSKKEIIETLEEIKLAGADIAKVAYMANHPRDVLEIMEAALYDLGIPKIMIAMGEYGKFWRAVSLTPPWNCWGMFASIDKPTAPGQLSVKQINDILKILK